MAVCAIIKLSELFTFHTCVLIVFIILFFYLKMGPIHHSGISDIKMALQINGSLTSPAADVDTRLSSLTVTKKKQE